MTKARLRWAAALMTAAIGCLDRPAARAADAPVNEVLKKHGFKVAGALAVADEEGEIKTKLTDARRISKQLSYAVMEQKGVMSPREQQRNIKNVNDEINNLNSELAAVNQQMSQVPRNNSQFGAGAGYGGRFGGGFGGAYGGAYGGTSFANNDAADMFAQLTAYRDQLQMELNQDLQFLNELKNQSLDPKAKDKIDAEVKEQREALHQAVTGLRKLVDAADAKYAEATKSDAVKKALVVVGKSLKAKVKLGPSREFLSNVKVIEKLEKADASGETEEPQATKTRRSRSKTKAKISSKPAAKQTPDAAGDSDGAGF